MAIFDFSFHNSNPWLDDYFHGDHTYTDEDGEEVVSPGTPDRPVVIEPEPEPDPDPAPAPESQTGRETNEQVQIGSDGNDTLYTSTSGQYSYGILNGGAGNDTLVVDDDDPPHVMLIGGPGNDVFEIRRDPPDIRIMDFQDGEDRIKLSGNGEFGQLVGFYKAVQEAGLNWDMRWIATEHSAYSSEDEAVVVHGDGDMTITIFGPDMDNLQAELVDGDLFIV